MKTHKTLYTVIIILLLCLWIPVAIDKLIYFQSFKTGILRQPLNSNLQQLGIILLPPVEIITACLLTWNKLQKYGLILSSLLMSVFTIYVAVALVGGFGKIPCGCGSVISALNWHQHLWFNLFFLMLSVYVIIINNNIFKLYQSHRINNFVNN